MIFFVDCNQAGDFQSITHSILSRNKRSTATDQSFSYKEDKPEVSIQKGVHKGSDFSQVTEDRIEGLEDTIDVLSDQLKMLKQKVSALETNIRLKDVLFEPK